MKKRERLKWTIMAMIAMVLFFVGRSNYHQRFPAQFVLIILAGMAVLIFAFYFLNGKERP